jgi:hypothetical protein
MPSVSQKQQAFMGADYARAKAGKKTKTGMSKSQLRDFAATKTKGLPKKSAGPKMRKVRSS